VIAAAEVVVVVAGIEVAVVVAVRGIIEAEHCVSTFLGRRTRFPTFLI